MKEQKKDKLENTKNDNTKRIQKDIKNIKENLKNIVPNINISKGPNHLKKIADKTEEFSDTIKGGVNDIRETFNSLGEGIGVLKSIGKAIGSFFKVVFWVFKFTFYIVGELLNPFNLFNDLSNSFVSIPRIIINVIVRLVVSFSKYIINNILNPIINKAFGWDINIDAEDKDKDKDVKRTDTKCYKAEEGTLPNTVIMSTILLPPLGIFMRFGLQKWLEILIAGALTMLYYIPGLIYSFIMIWPKN
jgi:uncharacterized membrane protein YqaE (UPF0057 family)